jgi:uncharacterized protein YjbJ (UPF0337 family)
MWMAGSLLVLGLAVTGCKKEEKPPTLSGEIDEAAGKAKETIDEGAEKAKEAVEEGTDKVNEALEGDGG